MLNNLSNLKVEIILPNYNSEKYLTETINSIINQTFTNWNLTIVDGNSNAETQKILGKYADYTNINIIKLFSCPYGRPNYKINEFDLKRAI